MAYLRRGPVSRANTLSRSSRAASVIAAGSVMKAPSSGTRDSTTKHSAIVRGSGSRRAPARTSRWAKSRIGRLPATTMIANTNIGSVKLRDSR